MSETSNLYDHLKGFFDGMVNTDVSLDSLGIDSEAFRDEAREIILQRVQDMASERLENNE